MADKTVAMVAMMAAVISLVRSTSHCLRGSRIPASLISSARYTYDQTEGIYTLLQH